jgi:sugar/nucleoside kinase (ribokinase family)
MVRLPGTNFDYVTVGHVTRDAIEHHAHDTIHRPGGGAFYSALQAARLGLRTLIVTQGVPEEIEALLAPYLSELELHVIPAERTTTLSTRGSGATRSQRMLAWAGPIVEAVELDASILHFAPVARETPVSWRGSAGFVGITPQGLVRRWAPSEDVSLARLDPTTVPSRFDAAAIGAQELDSCQALFSAARRVGAPVAVTAGSRPTTVYMPDGGTNSVVQVAVPTIAAVRDDLGAGDVFAAAFFVSLSEGLSPLEATEFGNAAAVRRIAGVGPNAVGDRAQIVTL